MPHGAMKHTPLYSCLQVPAEREKPHSTLRLTLELEVTCCPSVYFNGSIQTRSAQLAWNTSAPDSLPVMDIIYPLNGALHGPITWQSGHPGTQPHWVNSYWYIADTPSPAILGLPLSKKLAVVKMNCASSPHYLQSNGFAKACVKSVKHALQCAKHSGANPQLTFWCSELHSSMPSSHHLLSFCINARSGPPILPEFATPIQQPSRFMNKLMPALMPPSHRQTNSLNLLHPCMLASPL